MDRKVDAKRLIRQLAYEVENEEMLSEVENYLNENWENFKEDYHNSADRIVHLARRKRKTARLTCGKYEKALFVLLGRLCRFSTNKEIVDMVNRIMILCGYPSYKRKKARFRQMLENYKKNLKRKDPEKYNELFQPVKPNKYVSINNLPENKSCLTCTLCECYEYDSSYFQESTSNQYEHPENVTREETVDQNNPFGINNEIADSIIQNSYTYKDDDDDDNDVLISSS